MQHRRTSFLASHELLSELASEVAKACTNTKPASPKLYEVSSSVFNGHVDRWVVHHPKSHPIDRSGPGCCFRSRRVAALCCTLIPSTVNPMSM